MITNDVKLVTGLVGFFASMMMFILSDAYYEQTQTPPMTQLTLTQAGCEYVSRSGIAADVKNGICLITSRYRASRFNGSGYIEVPGISPLQISGGQVVGVIKLDDGKDESWSAEHTKAVGYLIGSFLMMLVFLRIMSLGVKSNKRK